MLTREEFLAQGKLAYKEIPALGDVIGVEELTSAEADAFDFDAPHATARLVLATARTGPGKPMFQSGDLLKLVGLGHGKLMPIARAALELSGLRRIGQEDLAKNSVTTASSPSGTGSPATSNAR